LLRGLRAERRKKLTLGVINCLSGPAEGVLSRIGQFDHGQGIYLDIARIQQDTGYRPAYDTERATADYIAWLRAGNAR